MLLDSTIYIKKQHFGDLKMIEKDRIEMIVKQWLTSGKPNQTIKLKQGWMISISSLRCSTPDIIDFRFICFSPNYQRNVWLSGDDINSYHDPYAIVSEIIYDAFRGLMKSEGINEIRQEQLNIKEGNIVQSYDKYVLPPSIDKEGI